MRDVLLVATMSCVLLGLGGYALGDDPAYSPAFSTYLGGSSWEQARGVVADADDFPTINAYQDSFAGGSGSIGSGDLVIVRFVPIPEPGTGALLIGSTLGLLGVGARRRA